MGAVKRVTTHTATPESRHSMTFGSGNPECPCGETNPINKYSGSPARTTNTGHRLVIGSLRVSGVGNLQVMFWLKGIQMYCLVERL